jgi:hypothetical protein
VVLSGIESGKQINLLKKLDQYIVSQVQSRNDHDVVVKQDFERTNYFSFGSAQVKFFVKISGL